MLNVFFLSFDSRKNEMLHNRKHKLMVLAILIYLGVETCLVHKTNGSFAGKRFQKFFTFQSHIEYLNHGLDILVKLSMFACWCCIYRLLELLVLKSETRHFNWALARFLRYQPSSSFNV